MGQGPECRDAGLPVADPVPRRDPRAADPAVELPQGGHPCQTRRCVVLFLQRRAAEPVGALPYDGPGAQGEVFLNPNTLSDDGTVALSSVAFSKDGKYCACAVAESGSDWVEIRVMNTADRTFTTDKINWGKFSGAEWAPDSKGFYYSAYDAPEKCSLRRTSFEKSITTASARRSRPTS